MPHAASPEKGPDLSYIRQRAGLPDRPSLTQDLIAAALTRDVERGWQRTRVEVAREWPEERRVTVPKLFLNKYQATDVKAKVREVDTCVWPVSDGEQARTYINLALAQAGKKRIWWRKDAVGAHLPLRPALALTDRPRRGEMAVVDIDRAYWQIAAAATADVHFRVLGDQADFLLGKINWPRVDESYETPNLGRSIVGTLGKTTIDWYRYGEKTHDDRGCAKGCRGPHTARPVGLLAPDLVGYVCWTMHAVATEATERFGASMWMVDAAVLDADQADSWIDWLRTRWGLTARIKHAGPTRIYGIGRYECGTHATDNLKFSVGDGAVGDNLHPCPVGLRDQLADIRERLMTR